MTAVDQAILTSIIYLYSKSAGEGTLLSTIALYAIKTAVINNTPLAKAS
jgi:hypothetical protein